MSDENAPVPEPSNTWYGPYGARPGVQRSDEDIAADVIQTLQDDPRINPSNLGIAIDHAVVTLEGNVDTPADRQIAEDDAWNVPGVVEVRNYLQTGETPPQGANM